MIFYIRDLSGNREAIETKKKKQILSAWERKRTRKKNDKENGRK